jgi:hypothetical protein
MEALFFDILLGNQTHSSRQPLISQISYFSEQSNLCQTIYSSRLIDKRPKFVAYFLTYSLTTMDLDYAYQQLLQLQFPITEAVMERHMDERRDIQAVVLCKKSNRIPLSPDRAIIGGEKPRIRGLGSKAVKVVRWDIRMNYADARGLRDFEEE